MTEPRAPGNATDWWAESVKLRRQCKQLRVALEPLARLKVPAKPQGNAGAYSIFHADIRRAQEALRSLTAGQST